MINADPITTRIAETISLDVIFSSPPSKKYVRRIVNTGEMLNRGTTVTRFPILYAYNKQRNAIDPTTAPIEK
jgi:hypothetical protein